MILVVGLGNPGIKYQETRHNVGFKVIDRLASNLQLSRYRLFCRALTTTACIGDQQVILAKPQTYMNNSGEAVAPLLNWYGLTVTELLVICDDLDLPLGRLRIRKKGGDGGHRGLKSIIEKTGSSNFPRIRLGIGRPEEKCNVTEWVLGPFTPQEAVLMDQAVARAAQAVEVIVAEGLDRAMNLFN